MDLIFLNITIRVIYGDGILYVFNAIVYANKQLQVIRFKTDSFSWRIRHSGTIASGKATFSYYNSDPTGTYRVIIEGIDKNEILGRRVFLYKVTP